MHTVKAKFFADCSGDSILSTLTGAEFRYGREASSEFGESIEPEKADKKTMGMSCLFQVRETDKPQPFSPPDSDKPFKLTGIRIVFDSDLNRDYQNMPCCIRLEENRFKLPETLIKNFDILLKHADGNTKVYHFHNNHLRFRKLDIQGGVLSVKFCRLKPTVQKHLIFIILKCFKSGKNPSRKLKSMPKLHENMILTRTQRRTNKQQEKRRGITPRLTLNL